MTMAPALDTIGVPVAGLAFMLGIDRIPDMIRSCVNVLGQISTAVIVDQNDKRLEGERIKDLV